MGRIADCNLPAVDNRPIRAGARLWPQAVIVLAVVAAATHAAGQFRADVVLSAFGIAVALALLVLAVRAGTPGAAVAGGICCFALLLLRPQASSGFAFSGAAPLAALLVLTTAATRIGRARKSRLGAAEGEYGRDSAQVLANIGVAAMVVSLPFPWNAVAATGALAESAADTLASEIGILQTRERVRLITGGTAPAGADGGVTVAGTAAAALGATCVAAMATLTLGLPWATGAVCGLAGIAGCFFDSLLGATLERRGLLSNNPVNFLSTLSAAAFACALLALLELRA